MKGYVVINIPESAIVERVYDTFNTNYLTLAIVLILSSAFLVLYFFQVHRPIKEITRATNEYSKGNLSYHVKPMHNDEIGRLGMSLDYMASQLNESDKFQQKFLSNISHDFRSPLTSIKGYLEAIEMELFHQMLDKYRYNAF
ncbi:MAG: HAMP domain-containing protein [Lachnospira pectinoschiza]